MSEYPVHLKRPLVPNGCRRAPWHDYKSRCIYMITLNAAPGMPSFSVLKGIPGNRDWPPTAVNTPVGDIIARNISSLKKHFPFIKILRRVIMPEHVHFVIFVEEATDTHLGDIIRHLKKNCSREYSALFPLASAPAELQSVFENKYHDRILLKRNQLKKMLAYVSDNPRRRLIRMLHPDFHQRQEVTSRNGKRYIIYGNRDLLLDPDIEAVKISRRYSSEELRKHKIRWIKTVENCGILVSPFISKDEKKVYNWALENGGRIIHVTDANIEERFRPKGIEHILCSEGRLLLVAPVKNDLSRRALTRAVCQAMNQLASDIAEGNIFSTSGDTFTPPTNSRVRDSY